ncbi:enoyl-CoA hydratase [Rhodococcus sp. X156]|uniref:enoyl-CoA hydratase n=1 Tax=Rhodococcus sp. X156 TaxID=2499145 RepID=UPI000FD85FF9|nr:enoyl-CoA hydratase [Rhodococcus sp. X156]
MINTSHHGRVTVLEIDRPERRNALSTEVCDQLREAVTGSVEAGARALVITGAGTSFCSGADLGGVYGDGFLDALRAMLRAVTDAQVPVIAAVNGPAIGAGTQLAVCCDLRVAAPTAVFGVPTAKLGLAADAWTLRRLAMFAGGGMARRMMLTAQTVTAAEALRSGLADGEGGLADALELATHCASLAPLSLAYSKRVLNGLTADGAREADTNADWEVAEFERCWTSADFAEGQQARRDKRSPEFQGR